MYTALTIPGAPDNVTIAVPVASATAAPYLTTGEARSFAAKVLRDMRLREGSYAGGMGSSYRQNSSEVWFPFWDLGSDEYGQVRCSGIIRIIARGGMLRSKSRGIECHHLG